MRGKGEEEKYKKSIHEEWQNQLQDTEISKHYDKSQITAAIRGYRMEQTVEHLLSNIKGQERIPSSVFVIRRDNVELIIHEAELI